MKLEEIGQLMPGMVAAQDVLNYNGLLLVSRGEVLQDSAIRRLVFHGITGIYVEEKLEPYENTPAAGNTYFQRVKKSPEFIEYQRAYEETVDNLKKDLNALKGKDSPLEVDKLMDRTLALLPEQTNGTPVFDMLQNMRQYDDATFTHSINVALICRMFARWLRFGEKETRMAAVCGLLHDVGKLMIPPGIMKKPGRLTAQEYDVIKQHTTEGYRFLTGKNADVPVRNAALMHHEKCDGSGYPSGLRSKQIDPYAKLVTIADIYDAMTSARTYRGPLCPFQVIRSFEEEGLQKYEPRYILTFLDKVAGLYIQNRVRLNDGTEGEIIMIQKNALSRPLIKGDHGIVDLKEHTELEIETML